MKIINYSEITPYEMTDFRAWEGAKSTLEAVIKAEKIDELAALVNEIFPDGAEDVQINDFLWFDTEYIFEHLGIA
jgi:hypothetical protein